jgi:deazaflavin-dependent oxidoreductase (nitroreductase family)
MANEEFELPRNICNRSGCFSNTSLQYRGSNGTGASMTWPSLQSVADKQVLYLTTIGRRTGLSREIEIWFVVCCERFYLFAETGEAAGWVKNIRRNPKVRVRIEEWRIDAAARVLDRHADRKLCDQVVAIADRKYGWGDGLPVEVTPLPPCPVHSDPRIKPGAGR